jgi:hypothetical protein
LWVHLGLLSIPSYIESFFYDDEDIFLWVHLDDDEDLLDFKGNFLANKRL